MREVVTKNGNKGVTYICTKKERRTVESEDINYKLTHAVDEFRYAEIPGKKMK